MTDERIAVICNPTEGFAPRVANCTREYCEVCAAEVWLSPASKAIAENIMVVCLDCAPGVMQTDQNPHLMLPTPAQLREVMEAMREEHRDNQDST